jgi:ABC-2 type transport system ATP-binding protein
MGIRNELSVGCPMRLKVRLKHAVIPVSKQKILAQWLDSFGSDVELGRSELMLEVDEEQKIAKLIRIFTQCEIDIYRVEVKETVPGEGVADKAKGREDSHEQTNAR